MPISDADEDNYCEGCMVRNTGDNFSHPAMCKSCMSAMMGSEVNEILEQDGITEKLAKNADEKTGPLRTWLDTDGTEVEITLPIPPGVTKNDLRVKASPTKLLVAAGERKLLFVDPLYDVIQADELVWCLLTGKDGSVQAQISLTKKHAGTRWGKTLSKEGGAFECWTDQLLPAPKDVQAEDATAAPAGEPSTDRAPAATSAKKPKFSMRDDGSEVEVTVPLPPGVNTRDEVELKVTSTTLVILNGSRQLMRVDPLFDKVRPAGMYWSFEDGKDGQKYIQLTLEKADETGPAWTTSLCKENGTFTFWMYESMETRGNTPS